MPQDTPTINRLYENAIAAAAVGIADAAFGRPYALTPEETRIYARAAVVMADRERAHWIIVAVDRLMNAIADGNGAAANVLSPVEIIPYRDEVRAARRDLLALLGIESD